MVWCDIKFEYTYLKSWLPDNKKYLSHRQNHPEFVRDDIYAIISLRNQVAHFPSEGRRALLGLVENYLRGVQNLTLQFYNKDRALKARALQHELRAAAQATVEEVARLEGMYRIFRRQGLRQRAEPGTGRDRGSRPTRTLVPETPRKGDGSLVRGRTRTRIRRVQLAFGICLLCWLKCF